MSQKLVVIVGQTASGKTDLAVKIAKKFNGEVISADSRQVYKDFSLCTGKTTKKEMQGVKHYLIDVLSAKTRVFSAYDFLKHANKALAQILKKGKLPIVAGGTGFYIDVFLGKIKLDTARADKNLRKSLEKKSLEELRNILKKIDKKSYQSIDLQNKRRVVRAIERAKSKKETLEFPSFKLEPIWIGIKHDRQVLRKRIKKRLEKRFRQGMCKEVQRALEKGISKKRIDELGLEIRYCLKYIMGEINKEELLDILEKKIWQYAKRQETYWKRNKKIKWFSPNDYEEIKKYVARKINN